MKCPLELIGLYEKRDLRKVKCQNCGKPATIAGTKAIILYDISTGKMVLNDAGYVKYDKMIYFWCEKCAREQAIKTLEYF